MGSYGLAWRVVACGVARAGERGEAIGARLGPIPWLALTTRASVTRTLGLALCPIGSYSTLPVGRCRKLCSYWRVSMVYRYVTRRYLGNNAVVMCGRPDAA